jgi:hypothetical protein
MNIEWIVTNRDISKIQEFYQSRIDSKFVKNRESKNIQRLDLDLSPDRHWRVLVNCLLTTQQRSGPKSHIYKFLHENPFPLSLERCNKEKRIAKFCEQELKNYGGIRRSTVIGVELEDNLSYLELEGWELLKKISSDLMKNDGYEAERKYSMLLAKNLKGIGPKQSRNYLQMLGLTKYEIPLDSRIMKWLNDFGFPMKLSASSLSDHNYYNFVLDGFRELCLKSGIYPCMMDAAIFSSFDGDDWG